MRYLLPFVAIIYAVGLVALIYGPELFGMTDLRPLVIWLFAGVIALLGTVGLSDNSNDT